MKTTISIFLMAIFGLFLVNQNVNAQSCIICNSNTVGDSSSAIGTENISTGSNSFAVGYQCQSEGNTAFSAGFKAKAIGDYSVSAGAGPEAYGYRSVAIGTKAISNNQDSYAFGINIKSSANNAFTLGIGPVGNQFLENSIENSMMFGIGSLYPTFLISKAYDENKTGKIGIGNVTNPDAKLHIRADDNEDASILLEPTGSGYMGKLMIGDDNHTIQARQGNNMEFKTEANKNFVFQNGSIYIQDSFEGLILKSPDGQCWKGTANNDGNFVLENIDCSLVTGKDEQSTISQKATRIFPNPAGSKLYVDVPEEVQQSYVSIYNEQGILLQSNDLQSGKNTIPLKKMPAGILIVKVYTDSGELLSTEKIMHR